MNISETEIEKIEVIEKTCFRDAWSFASLKETATNTNTICVLDEFGYIMGRVTIDECELYRIAVLPEYRRNGVARGLLNRFVDICKKRLVKRILLEVRTQNTEAVSFYVKNGFEKIAIRKKYYEDDDAAVYEMIL